MRKLIVDKAEQIAEDLGIDINKLSPRGMDELYTRAEEEVIDNLADMRDMEGER